MALTIRPAMTQDARAIAEIIQTTFHEQSDTRQIQQLIASGKHHTWVAQTSEVIGFVDGFLTVAQDGTRRLELDLIAVQPDFAGQGIGRQLIEAFSDNAGHYDLIRALVAVNNRPMERAMLATAYQGEPQIYALYVCAEAAGIEEVSPDAHLIPVETFTYRGIWLEGIITASALRTAQFQQQKQGFDLTGAVISTDNSQAIGFAQAAGFEFAKDYRWWTKID